jgi:ferredoxin
MRSMKVRVDADRCDGFGECAHHLPEVFVLDEWGFSTAVGDGEVPPGQEALARRAIEACPVYAISEVERESEVAGGA